MLLYSIFQLHKRCNLLDYGSWKESENFDIYFYLDTSLMKPNGWTLMLIKEISPGLQMNQAAQDSSWINLF